MLLKDKVAVITGATSGIGRATAEIFVREGARVVLAGRRGVLGRETAAALGPAAVFVEADVGCEDEVAGLIGHAHDRHGRIDCLFNNAGRGGTLTPVAQTDAAAFDEILAVNLRGPLFGIKHVAPIMTGQGFGSIINTASVGGSRTGFTAHDYSAAKAALIQLTKTAAVELGEAGVRVNCLSPGPTVTEIFAQHLPPPERPAALKRLRERFATMQPIPRAAEAADVANVALFLASDLAGFVSGQDIVIDGAYVGGFGWSALLQERADIARLIAGLRPSGLPALRPPAVTSCHHEVEQ
jgi:NAD(P)-dependent dehydrogenase (short-subunit alcohol dehydrogenase family)